MKTSLPFNLTLLTLFAHVVIAVFIPWNLREPFRKSGELQQPLQVEPDEQSPSSNGTHYVNAPGEFPVNAAFVDPGAVGLDPKSRQWCGYLPSPGTTHLFFWLFESRGDPTKDPLILWLQGGPAYSSLYGMLQQWGPKLMVYDPQSNPTYKLDDSPFALNEKANVIFLEQPAGTGFSYRENGVPAADTTPKAAAEIIEFLTAFFTTTFGTISFAKHDFHIAGPSYSGHTIPFLAAEIASQKKAWPLKSILVGNGATDELAQLPSIHDIACNTQNPVSLDFLLTPVQCAEMKKYVDQCAINIQNCRQHKTSQTCDLPECGFATAYYWKETNRDRYDLNNKLPFKTPRSPIEQYNLLETFFHLQQNHLGVDMTKVTDGKWSRVNPGLSDGFVPSGDKAESYQSSLSQLLSSTQIRVLLYAVRQK